ncbi:MAG: flagellar export protein FliJ [Alphaproteobacteria bacterium]|nr:flagellar export protein FliJ [Alphaproteobacteria bacterium]
MSEGYRAMKSRDSFVRVKRFELDEKARRVDELQYMIRDFEQLAADLERQIAAEEDRTGVRDVAHFAYSTFAKAAMQRRDNLMSSAAELRAKLESAAKDHDEARAQLARYDGEDHSVRGIAEGAGAR